MNGVRRYDPQDPPTPVFEERELPSIRSPQRQNTTRSLKMNGFDYDDALYYLLASIGLVILCFCSRSRVPGSEYRIWERRRAEWREQEARTERMSDPNYRMNLVMRGVLIKKIIQEKAGQLILGDDDGVDDCRSASSASHSIDSMDENSNTCVICLEPFRVGDVVAWSRMLLDPSKPEICHHVFHKDCILAWLTHPLHDDCPYCRSSIVQEEPRDSVAKSNGESGIRRTALLDETGRSVNSAFVIMHGLVSQVRRASVTLIGQSVNAREIDDPEIGQGRRSSAPPSTLRRVVSLEGRQSLRDLTSSPTLRRRPSLGSRALSTSIASLPDVPVQPSPSRKPQELRRSFSDISSLPPAALRSPPRPRPFETTQTLPYPNYFRSISFNSNGSGERDISDCTIEEEDDIVIRQVSPLTTDLSTSELVDNGESQYEEESQQGHIFV